MPPKMKLFKLAIIWCSVFTFIVLWAWFLFEVWTSDARPVSLNQRALYLASSLGGLLGTFFALALGVERKDPFKKASAISPGSTLLGTDMPKRGTTDALASVAVWAYGIVGVGALVTVFIRPAQSPGAVETLATVFGGYIVVIVTQACKSDGNNIGSNSAST